MLISDLSSEQLLMLIIPALPNMWALKHAMYHDFPTTQEKYRWMMACVFVPCLAGVAYYFVGRKHASREKVDIRARMEAERARAAEERAAQAGNAGEAEAKAAEPVADAAAQTPAGACRSEGGMDRTEECGRPEREIRSGDDWSFGCPDDVRKPQA